MLETVAKTRGRIKTCFLVHAMVAKQKRKNRKGLIYNILICVLCAIS